MAAYYNEFDPKAAAWLRELIKAKLIPDGEVDERSIEDVRPADLVEFRQCHFFAGIGGWAYAGRLAGLPDDFPYWTGSCPCQFSSSAARGRNNKPDLWPVFSRLVRERRPATLFGEQSAANLSWLDMVWDDLESMEYTVWPTILPALCVGKNHIRHRLYYSGHANGNGKPSGAQHEKAPRVQSHRGEPGSVAETDGLSARVGRLRGYGNAIVPQVAAEVIKAALEGTCNSET